MERKDLPEPGSKATVRRRLGRWFQDFFQDAFVPTSAEWFIAGEMLGATPVPMDTAPEEEEPSSRRRTQVHARSVAA